MRLWQKIFLVTLFLVTMSVNGVSLVLMVRSHKNSLILAKEKAQAVCEAAISELENGIQKEKERTGSFLLTEQELMELVSEEKSTSVLDCEVAVTPVLTGYDSETYLPEEACSLQTVFTERQKGEYQIRTAVTVFWEGRFYRVTSYSDVSGLMEQFHQDLGFIRWFGGAVSLGTAAILLAVSLGLTYPLKNLEAATTKIAKGEYSSRIAVKGQDEISELAKHMNAMAEEVEENISRMEQITQGRETFIADMAHELKTPLTSILGFADIMMIKSKVTEEERREYASIIAAEAGRLKLLSSRLMELVSLRETRLQLQPVSLDKVVGDAIRIFTPIVKEHHCFLQRAISPVEVEADGTLLISLILNLLDNALKASSPKQTIEISLVAEGEKAVLAVQDHGIGIPQEQLEHVTEAFYMVDKARSRSAGGSGIGLSLCKAITEAHYGTFEIYSRENCGTRVTLTFPISQSAAGSA